MAQFETISEQGDGGKFMDITAPKYEVQIEVDHLRSVVYVHVDGVTKLRICRIPGNILVTEYKVREK